VIGRSARRQHGVHAGNIALERPVSDLVGTQRVGGSGPTATAWLLADR
jgi:hypothetical protein